MGWPFTKDGQPYIYPWTVTMVDRDPLLQEREKTHGSFERNAAVSQALKQQIRNAFTSQSIYVEPVFQEALDMICLKISRICSGKLNEKDHWDDIAGYAKLAAEACK